LFEKVYDENEEDNLKTMEFSPTKKKRMIKDQNQPLSAANLFKKNYFSVSNSCLGANQIEFF
jgi:hypothetical protein